MPNFALLSTPGALLRKVPPLLRITFVCPLQSGFSFCSPFFRNSACSNHGRKPAMRFSEQVPPTADLLPAPHKICNKLLKICKLHTIAVCNNSQYSNPTPPSTQIQFASHLVCLFQAQLITALSASGPVTVWLLGSVSSSGSKRGYHTCHCCCPSVLQRWRSMRQP